MKDNSKFWDKMAHKYSLKPVPDENLYQQKLNKTQKLLTSNMNVLEFGCGTGSTSLHHAKKVKKIIATDFSPRMIEIANGKAKAKNINNVEFKVQSIEQAEYPHESFDLIMGHSILHLIKDKNAVMEKLHRFLKKDGYLVLNTPCIDEKVKIFKYIWKPIYKLGFFPYVQSFKKEEMIQLINPDKFEVLEQWDPDKMNIFHILKKK